MKIDAIVQHKKRVGYRQQVRFQAMKTSYLASLPSFYFALHAKSIIFVAN